MEQLGHPAKEMQERIANLAQTFGLKELLNSNLESLSGGQQQRVAIASALACGQRVLLLDEPTSALDVEATDELLTLLRKICDERGVTVLLAEHRIERAIGLVDSICVISGDGSATKAMVSEGLDPILRNYRMVPPVIELGQKMGWTPLPLNLSAASDLWETEPGLVTLEDSISALAPDTASNNLIARDLTVSYGQQVALRDANLNLVEGTIHAVMGPNGSVKTSLLWALQGSVKYQGSVLLKNGASPKDFSPIERIKHIAMVPQSAADLLVMSTVSAELADSDLFANVPLGTTASSFASMAGRIDPNRHPHDLSAGQQLALVLAIQLAKGAPTLLLDEPTRGLDYQAKRELASQLAKLAAQGKAILFASHDVEFVALIADHVSLIRDGRIVDSGVASKVLAGLGTHAPQVLQVTGLAWRVDQVASK
jgi:energy-coupling factor transport system ATP-binding protein